MPYGNKPLHFGHIGGIFVPADIFARFLRDRIGAESVLFISGTDCYGSPILESYRKQTSDGAFTGSLADYVTANHLRQKQVLDQYQISLDLYAASALGRAGEIHRQLSAEILHRLYAHHHIVCLTQPQFYDPVADVFLNGRQVTGRCPIEGCRSEVGYADECALGHQYSPADLIRPISALSGQRPVMKEISNWYFRLEDFREHLSAWISRVEQAASARKSAVNSMREFLAPPVIYLQRKFLEAARALESELPDCEWLDDAGKSSVRLQFRSLSDREQACHVLTGHGLFFRNGKTLVPFRLTGNVTWGVPAPAIEDMNGLTFWVWPESLWAPVSFTRALLEQEKRPASTWDQWWCTREARVYQFIGEDNAYFYGPAQTALFMALQGEHPGPEPAEGDLQLTDLIVNCHLLFLDRKASSSGQTRPPSGEALLEHYTADQLRAHFFSLSLGVRSVSFQPKPFNPQATARDSDPVLKEGNLLSNVLNRAVRSCFYTVQKYFNGCIPAGKISPDVLATADQAILDYERFMSERTFHLVMNLLDTYIREINKYWSRMFRPAEIANDREQIRQLLIDAFHMIRVAALLMHPIAPSGTEMIRDYLRLDERFWNWTYAFEPVYAFMPDPENHPVRFLEPRVDFFPKHPAQLAPE
jgi:methionyl-tRNA synthetase